MGNGIYSISKFQTQTVASHELTAEGSRMNTKLASLVNARRLIGGNGQAEQFIMYVAFVFPYFKSMLMFRLQ